ncbi:MAG: hypothetical protein PHC41_12445 [Lachnospiraceae bacterium]|nr:hypothetical protein [Lachnospiraceae bacterium]
MEDGVRWVVDGVGVERGGRVCGWWEIACQNGTGLVVVCGVGAEFVMDF